MTRLSRKDCRTVLELFMSGTSMELLAERMRVGIWQIECVIREAFKK